MTTASRLTQSRNTASSIYSTLFPILTLLRLLHFANVLFVILVTPSGISTDKSPLQSSKAECPIYVTPFGIEISLRLPQPLNAELSIDVTLPGITT